MKKRQAIAIFGSLLLVLGIYVGWCCRPSYVRPGLGFADEMPEEAWSMVAEWWESDDVFSRVPMTLEGFGHVLANPYRERQHRAVVRVGPPFVDGRPVNITAVVYYGRIIYFAPMGEGFQYLGQAMPYPDDWWRYVEKSP